MARTEVRMDEVKPGDVIVDLNVKVDYSEPYNDYRWTLDCLTRGSQEYLVTITLPNEHRILVERA